jgi:hypothetical protein
MSYLAQPTSKTEYGVVLVGDNIPVLEGVISLEQDVAPSATVEFANLEVPGDITTNGDLVLTTVTPIAGPGISIGGLEKTDNDIEFAINNTGVLSLIAGSGISLTANTGTITVSSFGADLINVVGVTNNYTAAEDDEYIGVDSGSNVTITLPLTVSQGRVYTVKDERGQGSGKITIQPPAGTLIDKKSNYVIGVPNQSVSMVYRGTGWWII